MKQRLLSIVLFILLSPLFVLATHIVGASLTYEHLGGATYRVTLKMYRDCAPGNVAFPASVTIQVRNPNGTITGKNIVIPFPGANLVPPNIDTCAVNPGICLEEAIYTKVVSNLTPNPGGYHLYYQLCCHNATLDNVFDPLNTGDSWYTYIPDNSVVLTNSSPVWVNPPPVFVCQNNNMLYDHSATDPDGDSLVYSMYTPYDDVVPTFPGNVCTFTPITWIAGYGPNNPLDPTGANTVNPVPNGILNGIPPYLGQYEVGVKCEEYRNGVKIGEIVRDFQCNVVYCPPLAVASFTVSSTCAGSTVTFTNTTSPPANTYDWDFGDATTFSGANPPPHTYPGSGPYTVTLIINAGTPCADTTTQVINFSTVVATASNNAPQCAGFPVTFTDGSTTSTGTMTGWSWDFGDGSPLDNSQNPIHTYGLGGTYTVTLTATNSFGCTDTYTMTVTIQSQPIANAGADTFACTNNPFVTLGGSILNATGGQWFGSGTFTPSATVLNPTYTGTPAEVAAGFAIVGLVTTGNGLCPADTDYVQITFTPGPTVSAGPDISVCKDTSGFPLSGSVTVATGGTWTTSGCGTFSPNPNVLNPTYIPCSGDTAAGTVTLYLTTTGNGGCNPSTDTIVVTFYNPPTTLITSNDSACAGNGNMVPISATSSTGTGIWTTSGTGTFSPSNTSLTGFYIPSAADNTAGSVTLTFTSTGNGGCQAAVTTQVLTLIPAPTAAFTSTSDCPWQPISFTDNSTTSVGSITAWNWTFSSGTPSTSTSQNPSNIIFPAGGAYNVTLIVTSSNGCVDTLVQPANIYYQPVADFAWNGLCLNAGTTFFDSSTVIPPATINSWNWQFIPPGSTSAQQNPIHFFPSGGTYGVVLIVTSSDGCADTISQNVNVNPSPTAVASADDNFPNIGQSVSFNGSTSFSNIVSWFWNFGDSTTATGVAPSHSYSQGGTYTVMLIVTDVNGCMDTTYIEIIVAMPPLVPSGFSPNGDANNDMLFVKGGPYKELEFRIYNNWGELIFIGTRQQDGWDGKRNGKDQPIGVYVWTVKAVLEDDTSHELQGDVTLLR